MDDRFLHSFQSDPFSAIATALLIFLLYGLAALLPVCSVLYVLYFLLTLPLRRNERARLFVDLLELGLKQGHAPEIAIIRAASSRDGSLGRRFRKLATHLQQGLRLSEALERVPRLLPPQVTAMLCVGEHIGDLVKVLPACREFLKDGISRVRGALNYAIVLAFVITPASAAAPIFFRIKVLPSVQAVVSGMFELNSTPGQDALPPFSRLIFGGTLPVAVLQAGFFGLLWLAALAYVSGPRFHNWFGRFLPGSLADWLLCRLPWRRKRLQRDFSAMLAVLLDAEVPELQAVTLAAQATANVVMIRRAARVCQLLDQGVKLPEAIRAMDDTGELHWRLVNALQRGGSFLRALAGWHQALDAKAFQLEQSAAQITTTLLVLFNGVIVASIVIAVFLLIIQIINRAVLW